MIFNTIYQRVKQILPSRPPAPGAMSVSDSSDRAYEDITRGLRPDQIDAIFSAANAGDTVQQARFALELPEKSPDIAHALQTRINAVCACDWEIGCEDTSQTAKEAVSKLTNELKAAGVDRLIRELMSALLPGYALQEILWGEGGKIEAFKPFPQTAVTYLNSPEPLLLFTNEPQPVPIPTAKMLYHRMSVSTDPCRGGLIRPLGWLYCFSSFTLKDLLSFIERYAQPFLLVKAASAATDTERMKLAKLIRAFGTSGGGVVSGAVDADFLAAPTTTGDVYFNFQKTMGDHVTKILLGQTATSGDASGWSKGSAQAQVRQDLLESDCRGLEETLTTQLLSHWQRFHFPQLSAPLTLNILCEPPQDITEKHNALKMMADAIGVAVRAGVLTPCPEIESVIREAFELSAMSKDVVADWEKAGNARAPITLAQQPGDPSMGAFPMSDAPARKRLAPPVSAPEDYALAEMISKGALEAWLGPVEGTLSALSERSSNETLDQFLRNPDTLNFGDSSAVEQILMREAAASMQNGVNSAQKRIHKGEKS